MRECFVLVLSEGSEINLLFFFEDPHLSCSLCHDRTCFKDFSCDVFLF